MLRQRLGRAVRLAIAIALGALAVWVVAGRRDELIGAEASFEHIRWGWIALAVPVELASIVAFAATGRRLLNAGRLRVGLGRMTGIALAGNAIENSLPGGMALAGLYAFRQYRRRGADEVLAAWTVVAVGVITAVALAILAGFGLIVAGGQAGSLGLIEVLVGVVFVGGVLAVFVRRRSSVSDATTRAMRVLFGLSQRVVRRPRGDVREAVDATWGRLTAVTPGGSDWAAAVGYSFVNSMLDCTCFGLAFPAVGATLPLRPLLFAYGVGQLAATLPITPGGLGVVEGSLAIALVAYGGAEAPTVAAVLLYRIISFWLLLPVGWGSWGVLTLIARRRDGAEVMP